MALSASTIHEVQTGGSDTNNSGMFDPSQTAGMFTDGAATSANTSAPVFTSVSYNFVAGDVGAWLYIASGTNWTAGWYQISSVAANAATLNGTIGQAVLKTVLTPTTVVGCATTASPTGATWTIDYSQQASAQFTYTDLASAGAGLTVSSVAKPFAKQQVGNSLLSTGGTNFNTGRWVIASVAAGVATLVGPTNITTGAGVNGTGAQGGAFASPGQVGAVLIGGSNVTSFVFVASGTYTIANTSANTAGGPVSVTVSCTWVGYTGVRGSFGAAPLLQVASSGVTAISIMSFTGGNPNLQNFSLDGQSKSMILGFNCSRLSSIYKLSVVNCTNGGIVATNGQFFLCKISGCSTVSACSLTGSNVMLDSCEVYSNTISGVTGTFGSAINCLVYNNSGASSDGFGTPGGNPIIRNCTSHGNGRAGFRHNPLAYVNCVAEGNAGKGFDQTSSSAATSLLNCAAYNNTGGNVDTTNTPRLQVGFIPYTSTAFTNAASGDFSLNNTVGGGASLRGLGMGALLSGLTIGYPDIGAAQHADPAGGVSRSRVQAGF